MLPLELLYLVCTLYYVSAKNLQGVALINTTLGPRINENGDVLYESHVLEHADNAQLNLTQCAQAAHDEHFNMFQLLHKPHESECLGINVRQYPVQIQAQPQPITQNTAILGTCLDGKCERYQEQIVLKPDVLSFSPISKYDFIPLLSTLEVCRSDVTSWNTRARHRNSKKITHFMWIQQENLNGMGYCYALRAVPVGLTILANHGEQSIIGVLHSNATHSEKDSISADVYCGEIYKHYPHLVQNCRQFTYEGFFESLQDIKDSVVDYITEISARFLTGIWK